MSRTAQLLIVCATALVVVAACAQQLGPPPRHARGTDVRLAAEIETIQATVPPHATLDSLLRANRLSDDLVTAAVGRRALGVQSAAPAPRPAYRLVRSLDGLLREFTYQIDADRFLRIVSHDRDNPEALDARVIPYEKTVELTGIEAHIDGDHPSLIAAIDESGERIQLAMELADIFNGQVDFQTELQPGDSFDVLFEKTSHDGEFSGYGAVLGASIRVDGRAIDAFRWTDPATGHVGYYDAQGRSLKRFLLKSPLKFEPRITSGFTTHRFHPIDHVFKPHLGVDYGAPTGAPVVAVAGGVVVSAAYSGAGGNMVHLKHPGGFETSLPASFRVRRGHPRGQPRGAGTGHRPGRRYRRGNGSPPGLSIEAQWCFVNPVSEHARQGSGEPIGAGYLASFRTARDKMMRDMTAALAAHPVNQ